MFFEALLELPTAKYEKAIKTSTFTGRADAVHQGLVIEYERPRSFRHAPKRDEAVRQACEYLTGLTPGAQAQIQKATHPSLFPGEVTYSQEQEEGLAANVGLATDGERFIFVQPLGKR